MTSRFNTLLHGEASDAAAILGGEVDGLQPQQMIELRAALTNALTRIDRLERKAVIPQPVRHRYKVAADPTCAPKNLHPLDTDVPGVYFFDAIDSEEALDRFHNTVAIKRLDDFEIDVEIDG